MKTSFWETEKTNEDVINRLSKPFYNNGIDWVSELKIHKNDLIKRYEIAIKNLPLPAGFNEAILALRMQIKNQIKLQQDYLPNLNRLYELAVWFSFCPNEFSQTTSSTDYAIFERIIGSQITSLSADYQEIGYDKLTLLKKTDIKLLIQNYGEPKNHQTLNEMYRSIWLKEESSFSEKWHLDDPTKIELLYGYKFKQNENGSFEISNQP